jgi:hypothetical protein
MVKPDAAAASPDAKPAQVLRVTFAYRGNDLAVAGTRRVRMILPPALSPPPERGQSGYWVEVRAADGALLFHRALHSPVRVDAEIFTGGESPTIARAPIVEPQGEFEVLVPDLPEAQSLLLYGPAAEAQLQALPARELLRVGFDELRKLPPETREPGQGTPDRPPSKR